MTLPTRRRILLLVLLALVAVPPAVIRAAPADAGLVLEALRVLDEEYVDQAQIDRVRLLNLALDSIKATVSRVGITAKFAPIPPRTPAAEAGKLFRAAFDAAILAAQGKLVPRELAYDAIVSLTNSLHDSHTGFLTPEQYRERLARQRQQAGFAGVGMVVLPKDGRFFVWQVIPKSPAERAGVRPFDRIARVNGVPTGGMTVDQVVSQIRGPAGTAVAITFERRGRSAPLPLTITRAPITVPAVLAERMLAPGIGYIYLSEFAERSARDLRRALQELAGRGMRALVLDLRSNSGGFLHELRAAMGLLLPRGVPVYRLMTSRGTEVVRTDRAPLFPLSLPVVLLVDGGTASASELLAAAVREHGRGALVGLKTAGAVEASVVIELSDGSALTVTIRRLSTGKGQRLEGVGVTPEVVVDLSAEDFLQARDAQLEQAVAVARARLSRPAGAPPSPVPTR